MLALTFTFLTPLAGSNIPWLVIAAPGAALFPFLALFIWLDISRYKAYLPLYIAGKCIGIFSLLIFSIISGQFIMIKVFFDTSAYAALIFLSGDLFALGGILYIFKDFHKSKNKNASDRMEDNRCE